MTSKTHIAVGVAAALAVTHPETRQECCIAVMGGALGAVLPDIDILRYDDAGEARLGDIISLCLLAVGLFLDRALHLGMLDQVAVQDGPVVIAGAAVLAALVLIGIFCEHRGFTHSLLGMALYTVPIYVMLPAMALPFAAGFFSHMAIDTLNYRPVRLFYPFRKGICFRLCRNDSVFSIILACAGAAASALLLGAALN